MQKKLLNGLYTMTKKTILQVIHGYPPRFNAGSEVYTQALCHELAKVHDVHVFSRYEDPFAADYTMIEEADALNARVRLHLINLPRTRDRYRHRGVDERFTELIEQIKPDIVHIGHLNHLSTSLVERAANEGIPVVYTLHDFWLMCPRGQFMQTHAASGDELWALCDGQADEKCAERCYAHEFSGSVEGRQEDVEAWTRWVSRRMEHIRGIVEKIDGFIAPSETLAAQFRESFPGHCSKLRVQPYGFDRGRLSGRDRRAEAEFCFGYIGTHKPAKGIHLLIEAFGKLGAGPRLRIWGRRAKDTEALEVLASQLPRAVYERIEWRGEYQNVDIVNEVFDEVDAIVVPSIWLENSPLVIQEALQTRVPVITADAGGMAELVRHEVNGLLFKHRSSSSLAEQMQCLLDNPELSRKLGGRGYLGCDDGSVTSIEDDARRLTEYYDELIRRRRSSQVEMLPGPWRITFDTNPDDCNMHCIMCEEHSIYSTLQVERRKAGRPPRRMDLELIKRVLRDSEGTGLREIIPSTMGEPLIYKHFEDIIELCHEHSVMLNLTTNGTFPGKTVKEWAELIVPVTSDVKISWNAASPQTHEAIMIGSRWETVLDNVRQFIAVRDEHARSGGNRCRVTFQLTFMTLNVREVPGIVKLAANLGVDRVKGHHLWAHFGEIKTLSMRQNSSTIKEWNHAVELALVAADKYRLKNGEKVLLENIRSLSVSAVEDLAPHGRCPFLGQEAWVSAEGRFNPCCAPDEQRKTLGEFGDLKVKSIREVWAGDDYRNLASTYRNRALCMDCNMKRPALEV